MYPVDLLKVGDGILRQRYLAYTRRHACKLSILLQVPFTRDSSMRLRKLAMLKGYDLFGVACLLSSWEPVHTEPTRDQFGKRLLRLRIGPAHAVYFATYETVKQGMGGNEGTEHHPLAAGKLNSYNSKGAFQANDLQRPAEPVQQSPATAL